MVEPNNNLECETTGSYEVVLAGRGKNKKGKKAKGGPGPKTGKKPSAPKGGKPKPKAKHGNAKGKAKPKDAPSAAQQALDKSLNDLALKLTGSKGGKDPQVQQSVADSAAKAAAEVDAEAEKAHQAEIDEALLRSCRIVNGKDPDTGRGFPALPEKKEEPDEDVVYRWEIPKPALYIFRKRCVAYLSESLRRRMRPLVCPPNYGLWIAMGSVRSQVVAFARFGKLRHVIHGVNKVISLEDAKKRFIVSKPSNRKMTFSMGVLSREGILDPSHGIYDTTALEAFAVKDCGGNPFCALVAADMARGKPVDIDKYHQLYLSEGDYDPICVGTSTFLNETYSFKEGFNLILLRDNGTVFSVQVHDDTWDTVVLRLDLSGGESHWLLVMPASATDCGIKASVDFRTGFMPLSTLDRFFGMGMSVQKMVSGTGQSRRQIMQRSKSQRRGWFGPWNMVTNLFDQFRWTVELDRTVRLRDDRERRTHNMAREDIEANDLVDVYKVSMVSVFGPFSSSATFEMSCSRIALTLARKSMTQLKSAGLPLSNCGPEVYRHMHSVNCPAESPGLVINSLVLAEVCVENGIGVAPILDQDVSGLYTADAFNSTVPMVNKMNETQAGRGCCIGGPNNSFKKFRRPLIEAEPKVVNARAGPVIYNSDLNKIGDGEFHQTCDINLAVACGGRNMVRKENPDAEALNDFMDKAKNMFIPYLLKNVDVSTLVEQEWEEAFRRIYKGKRTQKQIDDLCSTMDSYMKGSLTKKEARKFKKFGMFVKWESNVKAKRGRPRLIMTMSDFCLIKTVQIHDLLHAFYEGNVKQFQIKGFDQDEINDRILKLTEKLFYVTDYSSFECSITSIMRELETSVMKQLCTKAGYSQTKRAIDEITAETRTLSSKAFDFSISSRCSGFPQTSAGNGIVNICVNMYCAYLKGLDWKKMDFIGEGDDGLGSVADPDVMKSVGLSLSMGLKGVKSGDSDFCSVVRTEYGSLLDVSKTLVNMMHVKNGAKLKLTRRRWLLRVKAYSTWLSSPNHPIIGAACVRIGEITKGAKPFKGWSNGKYVNTWKGEHEISAEDVIDNFPTEFNRNVGLSALLDVGTCIERNENGVFVNYGMPPVPVATQLVIEKNIMESDGAFYLGDMLGDYSNWQNFALHDRTELPVKNVSPDMDEFLHFLATIDSYKGLRPTGEVPANLDPCHLGSRKLFYKR